MLLIKNGVLHTAVRPEPLRADLLVENGRIARIAPEITENCETLDAAGLSVYPGFVEAHSHIGLDGYGVGKENKDYNEYNDILCPQLRAIDGIKAMDPAFALALAGGVTTMATGPGSANVLGGTFVAVKPVGKRVDDMVIKPVVAMKCAFGENPKRCYEQKSDSCRMTTAAKLREMLFRARDYQRRIDAAGEDSAKRPAYDMKLEALLPVLRGEIPLKAHAHVTDDLFTAIRIAKEFGVGLTLEHVTEGHLVPELLAAEQYPLAVGPSLGNASKYELRNKSWTTPGALARAGCQVSIITDAPVIPQQYLALCAGLAVKSGMEPFAALQAITINPARHIGLAERVGSLEAGKDADIVLADGSPFEVSTNVRFVLVNGAVAYTGEA